MLKVCSQRVKRGKKLSTYFYYDLFSISSLLSLYRTVISGCVMNHNIPYGTLLKLIDDLNLLKRLYQYLTLYVRVDFTHTMEDNGSIQYFSSGSHMPILILSTVILLYLLYCIGT